MPSAGVALSLFAASLIAGMPCMETASAILARYRLKLTYSKGQILHLERRGVRSHTLRFGKGPPVVIAVGWLTDVESGSFSSTYNGPFFKLGAARHLAVRYEGRGLGKSDRGVRDYSIDARVRDTRPWSMYSDSQNLSYTASL